MAQLISYDEFVEKYKPIHNHIGNNGAYDGTMFETYGDELDFVRSQADANKVWTLIDGDNENSYIIAGYHLVDRMGYFVTENQWEDENIEVDDNETISLEVAEQAFNDFCNENHFEGPNFNYSGEILADGKVRVNDAKYNAIKQLDEAEIDSEDYEDEIHDFYSQL